MKEAEAVQCRLRFKCPNQGCQIAQRWLSLCRHLTLFHKWRHASIDKWRDTLSLADAVGTAQPRDRKSNGKVREQKTTPPVPRPAAVVEPDVMYKSSDMPWRGFPMQGVVRFT